MLKIAATIIAGAPLLGIAFVLLLAPETPASDLTLDAAHLRTQISL